MYKFKQMKEADLNILFNWINQEHVKRWWDSSDNWDSFCTRYKANIASNLVFPHIVYSDGEPIGYINYWFVEEDEDFNDLYPSDTVGTDQFIGDKKMIGKGHGSAIVKQFTNELLLKENINLVITDPDPKNIIAVKCYKNAGFTAVKEMSVSDGTILLMEKSIAK